MEASDEVTLDGLTKEEAIAALRSFAERWVEKVADLHPYIDTSRMYAAIEASH